MAILDPQDRIERLLAGAELRFQTEFLAVLAAIRDSIDLDDLATLLEQGRFLEAFAIVQRATSLLNVVWSESFVAAGVDTASFLNAGVGEIVIGFDQTNFRAVRAMQDNQLRLVTEFTEQQRRATQQALIQGINAGASPRDQARAFRNSIGLTQHQEQWVRNYEKQLQELDAGALRRELRDRRFDPTVLQAIDNGEPLTAAQIEKMVSRYRQRWLKLRSETISRTEALRATHEGVKEMYDQAIDAGELLPEQLVRIWNTARDERVRDFGRGNQTSHVTMHNQERQIGVPFASGAGNQTLNPGAFGVGLEDINCRCIISTRILSLEELPGLVSIQVIEG